MTDETRSPNDEPIEPGRILVVDDNDRFRTHLGRALERREFEVSRAADDDEALDIAEDVEIDYAVVDLRMPGPDGLELIRDIFEVRPELDVIVLTGYGSIATAVDAIRLGAANYIQKPADAGDVLAAFERGHKPPLEDLEQEFDAPTLDRAEWEHIQRVLADCGGNISEAARQLGIHRRTLQRKLNRYAPDRNE